ncbi:MAG: hypothetical protein EWV92_17820 [Microcystis aeruginosa Ma_MB_S_20031200_S102]|uniref:Uncharacterized protein n=1 Tax=Microcystis aeruginosa Ma_MB_S_20031200_S102 TaxID=2486254 RepID=A0A552EEV8_MICAE|nr:MAG: hypothetical protein EWV79_09475 [Microcystis aeruginosa Ma_MB_S_20031200_S102D]TRU33026.1 MAG: hypothetical protein EWV92_17820 [Microcystis aeruginosa Ma_MB_S_20031200_S102]
MGVGSLIEFYFKLIICITIPEEPFLLVIATLVLIQNRHILDNFLAPKSHSIIPGEKHLSGNVNSPTA